ncbi:hypothetical protein FNV43_RR07372 [Rhamnella rubrinervis]|uniref:Uncharacterized protein n=1 Tax=Rhamnella rubrinervis TaxID=2594499 RepID=A0A8K0HEN4_9ROSA|nr:hypothetical protein FNV43_RR07372 [Rhamnella rubrinervis]
MTPYEALHGRKCRSPLYWDKYVHDPSHIIEYEPLEVHENLTYEEKLVEILDRKEELLRNREIPLVNVLWRNHTVEEARFKRGLNQSKVGLVESTVFILIGSPDLARGFYIHCRCYMDLPNGRGPGQMASPCLMALDLSFVSPCNNDIGPAV